MARAAKPKREMSGLTPDDDTAGSAVSSAPLLQSLADKLRGKGKKTSDKSKAKGKGAPGRALVNHLCRFSQFCSRDAAEIPAKAPTLASTQRCPSCGGQIAQLSRFARLKAVCTCASVLLCVRVCVYVCVCARTDSAAQCRDRNELSVHRLRRQADHQGRSDGVKAQIAAQSEWRAA